MSALTMATNGHRYRKIAPRAGTYLPKASRIGYGKYRAHPGDLVSWEHDGALNYGRVVGRIVECAADGLEDCTGHLVIVALGSTLAFGMERWIAPEEITLCEPIERAATFLARFLSADAKGLARYLEHMDSRDLVKS